MSDGTNVAPVKMHPLAAWRNFLETRSPELRRMLPAHIPVERFVRVALTAIQRDATGSLIECSKQSFWNACMTAANSGLLPDGEEGAITAFKQRAQFMPMYKGLIKKFRNSGQAKWINAGIVYQGEEFAHWIDEQGEHFKHVPSDSTREKADIRYVYALATTKDGGSYIKVMTKGEIERIQKVSRANRSDSPWNTHWEAMACKTALRQLAKLLPSSSDLDDLMRDDEGLYDMQGAADVRRPQAVEHTAQAAAIEHFSGADPQTGEIIDSSPTTEEQTATDEGASGETLASEPSSQPGAPIAFDDAIAVARNRGRDAHSAGMTRKAIPPEYREPKRKAEADAWFEGWDAKTT